MLECRHDSPLSQQLDELAYIARHHQKNGGDTHLLFSLVSLQAEYLSSAAKKMETDAAETRQQIEALKSEIAALKKPSTTLLKKTGFKCKP